MGAALRFGRARRLEALCEREYGTVVLDSFHRISNECGAPVPIMGLPAAAYRGLIIPRSAPIMERVRGRAFRNLVGSERGGFASLSDLIAEATTGGKAQTLYYNKAGAAPGATAGTSPLWNSGNVPPAGGVGGASGTGEVPSRTATGALKQADAAGGDTLHVTSWTGTSTVAGSVMLYDRLWHMTYNHASATTTSVDSANRPTRYQGTNAAGNVCTSEVTTVLSATAHTLGITYVDQDGNTAEANTNVSVRASSAVQTLLFTAPQWTHILNSPDHGLRYITEVDQSTITSVTGVSSVVILRPLAILPLPAANIAFVLDGINSAFNLIQVLDGACLALMDFSKSGNTAATMNGWIKLVSG
jgi:hypothetical protein